MEEGEGGGGRGNNESKQTKAKEKKKKRKKKSKKIWETCCNHGNQKPMNVTGLGRDTIGVEDALSLLLLTTLFLLLFVCGFLRQRNRKESTEWLMRLTQVNALRSSLRWLLLEPGVQTDLTFLIALDWLLLSPDNQSVPLLSPSRIIMCFHEQLGYPQRSLVVFERAIPVNVIVAATSCDNTDKTLQKPFVVTIAMWIHTGPQFYWPPFYEALSQNSTSVRRQVKSSLLSYMPLKWS